MLSVFKIKVINFIGFIMLTGAAKTSAYPFGSFVIQPQSKATEAHYVLSETVSCVYRFMGSICMAIGVLKRLTVQL